MSRMPYTRNFSKSPESPSSMDSESNRRLQEYIDDVDFYEYFFSKETEVEYTTDSELDNTVDIDDFTSSAGSSVRSDSPAPESSEGLGVNPEDVLLKLMVLELEDVPEEKPAPKTIVYETDYEAEPPITKFFYGNN